MSDFTLKTSSGQPIEEVFIAIAGLLKPTQADLRVAGEIVKTGIRDRTAKGVDAAGAAFAPYSTKGPYYYHAASGGRKLLAAGATEGRPSKSGRSLVFSSYGAFKRAFGRTFVDLQGITAPHMLDAIVVTPEEDGVRIGIYDSRAATIASGHNRSSGRPKGMPQRRFFGVGTEDIGAIQQIIRERIIERAIRK